jgi:hypothetical protein
MVAKRKYEAVLIKWLDAEVSNSWEEIPAGEDKEDTLVETLGFLVKETDKYYTIASTLSEEHTNAKTRIPVGMVKEIKKVKV